ncbi:MAG: hypothetical protein CMR00_01715 [[Chlorobium] sp. 445]|nr:MAG: hypothetical protein CMR00_01715 [[Chlorobium] sp. 445]
MQGQKFIVLTAVVMLSHSAALGQFLDIERGNRAFNRGEYDEAKRYYDKVLTEKEKLEEKKEALFNSASVDYKKKEYENAIKQFESLAQNKDLSQSCVPMHTTISAMHSFGAQKTCPSKSK